MKLTRVIWIDLKVSRKVLLMVTAGLVVVVLVAMWLASGVSPAEGLITGVAMVYPYAIAHFCFVVPRRFGLLKRFLDPITPFQLVWAKNMSAFLMALIVASVPSLIIGDFAFLLHINAGVLLLTAVCMAAAVIWPNPIAPLIPLFFVLIPYLYFRPQLKEQFDWVQAHATAASIVALCVIPLIVYASAIVFDKAAQKGALDEHSEHL